MSDLMEVLYFHALEQRLGDFLPAGTDTLFGSLAEERETALAATLTPAQQTLWDQWRSASRSWDLLCEQALFQAAFSMARELG